MNNSKILYLLALILFFSSCRENIDNKDLEEYCPIGDLAPLHLTMGNPSNAQNSESTPNNYLMEMDEYTISYNRDKGIPNWVSWYLSSEWYTGNGNRQDDFRPNPFLPSGWYTPDASSYQNSGFDRGHNCPSADRLCSDNFNSATFFMSNMIPQSPYHNQVIWVNWECYLRYLADQGMELYVIMGNYGVGGEGFFGYREKIIDGDDGEITVPQSVWKVAIAIPKADGNDIERINNQSEVIAIDIPNLQSISDLDWDDSSFITTIDDIEEKTGYDIFSNLPTNIQNSLENTIHQVKSDFSPCSE